MAITINSLSVSPSGTVLIFDLAPGNPPLDLVGLDQGFDDVFAVEAGRRILRGTAYVAMGGAKVGVVLNGTIRKGESVFVTGTGTATHIQDDDEVPLGSFARTGAVNNSEVSPDLHQFYSLLAAIRDRLIESFPNQLSTGNCFVTAHPVLVPHLGRRYVQVFGTGASFSHEGGGNLERNAQIVVRVYNELSLDSVAVYVRQGEEIVNFVNTIVARLHQWYDESVMAECMFVSNEGRPAPAPSDKSTSTPTVYFQDLTFSVVQVVGYDRLEEVV